MLPLPHFTICSHIIYCLNQIVKKAKFFGARYHYNRSAVTPRFKGRRPLIHHVIAKIIATLISVLMLCINWLCSLKLIKSIEAIFVTATIPITRFG